MSAMGRKQKFAGALGDWYVGRYEISTQTLEPS